MEQNIVVYIGIGKFLGAIGTIISAVAWICWFASRRLTRVETKVEGFEKSLTTLEGRLDHAFANASPIALLEKGQEILEGSGLKKYIDDGKDDLLAQCKSKNAMTTQYDVQESVFNFFSTFDFGDFELKLKEAAFKFGVSMEVMRRIGAIYFRDICLQAHNFRPEDLDKPKA